MNISLLEPILLDLPPQPAIETVYPADMHSAIVHASGSEDVVFAAAPNPRMFGIAAAAAFTDPWLPEGHHWDLHIEHKPLENAGTFTSGGHKLCWHSTESKWERVDLMWQVLRDKHAAPHFIIGGRAGLDHPVVIQTVPLNRAARALAHPSGPETNRACAVQVEICGFAAEAHNWTEARYKAFANLFVLITHRFKIDNAAPQDFSQTRRMGGQEWVDAKGHVDHAMCPVNDHTDVGRFREGLLMKLIKNCPEGGYEL